MVPSLLGFARVQAASGEIEIAEQDEAHIVAKLTPKGRALLDQLRTEQQRQQTDDPNGG